jgi:steroid delta-isomerase-like uncharacterized protein
MQLWFALLCCALIGSIANSAAVWAQETPPPARTTNATSLEENKALVRRFVEEVQNRHALEAIDELFSRDFVNHSPKGNAPPNIAGAKAFHAMLFAAFPDLRVTIHQQIAEGNQVVTYKTFAGTHRGEFMGVAATGQEVTFEVIDIFTVVDGHITEHWAVAENPRMQPSDVVPPSARGQSGR